MALKRWIFAKTDKDKVAALRETLGISKLSAAALVSRGVVCKKTAARFLECDYPLGDALELADMEAGAERVREAIEQQERIAVFGDYDVDGIMSTALIHQYLESAGADVVSLLPSRDCTGYGLVPASVDEIEALGATLILTVDNGVSSHEAVAYAKEKGIDTVISDHHKVPETIPDAVAVIDPLRADDTSTFKTLAGVGVALKFAAAIEGCSVEEMLEQYGYFAAIGTVSDVMPLVEENRLIVKQGLSQLAYGENLGLAALIEEVGLNPDQISAQDVAFTLAPRLNAAGRMASAETALRMLLTDDWEVAKALAAELSELNGQRQAIEHGMMDTLIGNIIADPAMLEKPILVLAGDYNAGVSGIVCSRLVERFGKPVIIISLDEAEAKGSGRSVEGFSLYDAIDSCSELLSSFGGHDMAAGFTIDASKIDTFKNRINAYCKTLPEPIPYRQIEINSEIEFSDIGEKQISELLLLAPFGSANEEPVFATLSAELTDICPLGEKHSRLTFKKNDKKLKAALFCTSPEELVFQPGDKVDIAYVLSLYTPQEDRCCVSVKLKCIAPKGFSSEDFKTLKIFDRMNFGQQISKEERALIAPTREEVGSVYRAIRQKPLSADDREHICYRFSELTPGRALSAVTILKELDLFENSITKCRRWLVAKENPEKRELEQSKTYLLLHKAE